jgi:hypothetical protein
VQRRNCGGMKNCRMNEIEGRKWNGGKLEGQKGNKVSHISLMCACTMKEEKGGVVTIMVARACGMTPLDSSSVHSFILAPRLPSFSSSIPHTVFFLSLLFIFFILKIARKYHLQEMYFNNLYTCSELATRRGDYLSQNCEKISFCKRD